MKVKFLTVIWFVLGCCFSAALAQTISVKGTVTDESKLPMPGVSVVVKGTTHGTSTDIDGKYELQAKAGDVLEFSSVGYTTQTKKVVGGGKSYSLSVVLKESTQELSEVVVVGFGTQKKVNLTGSVSSVDSKAIESRPVATVTEALQGLVPGLNISTSGAGGQLDATKGFNIRGAGTIGAGSTSSPLVLIDGMEGNMNAINPNDIENISVLKDAAAASIYGSRAPFGVILITTKKGKSGKVTVHYSSNLRADSPIIRPKNADSYSWATYFNDADVGGTQFQDWKLQQIKDYQDGKIGQAMFKNSSGKWEAWDNHDLLPIANTDWLEEHYKKTYYSYEHNLSVSGGSDKSQYYLSTNYLNRDGLFKYAPENLDRYTLSGKVNTKVNDKLSVGYNVRFIRQNYEAPSYLGHNAVFFHDIIRYWPIIPLKDPNGNFTRESKVPYLRDGGRKKSEKDWMYTQLSLNYNFTKNWDLHAEFNYRIYSEFYHQDNLTTYAKDAQNQPYIVDNETSSVYESGSKENFLNPNIYSNYHLNLESGHNFKFMTGFQSELLKSRALSGNKQNLINSSVPTLNTASGKETTNGGYNHWATAGFFGRVNYDYQGRYLLEINGRYDGTSRFLRDQRWSFFPSFSAGWNVAQEKFWEPYRDYVSTLKFRGSWGELGNQNTQNWYPLYTVMGYATSAGGWILGDKKPNVAWMPGLISSSYGWENVRSWNAGLDVTALKGRLNLNFDYFVRTTIGMIGPARELPHTLGAAVPKTNNADMESRGFELIVNWRDKIGEDFHYGIGLTLADSRQKILKYPNPSGSLSTWYEGRYDGEIWGYTTKGIAKTQEEMNEHLAKVNQTQLGSNWSAGDIMYEDLNGDGKISAGKNTLEDHGDLSIIGNQTPRYNYGITLDAAYKGFDFKIFLQGVGKRDYAVGGSYFWGANGGKWQTVVFKEHLDYFRNDPNHPLGLNLDSYYPRPDWGSGRNRQTQTRYLQNAAYMRIKNIQLGYTLPQEVSQKVGISNLRVYISGENIFTFTKLSKLYDPEMLGIGYGGEGSKTYPLSKTWALGLSLTL